MSWAFINAMKKNPQQSYVQLLNSIRDELATKYTQKPQLSSSHPLSKLPLYLSTHEQVIGSQANTFPQTPTCSSSCKNKTTHNESKCLCINGIVTFRLLLLLLNDGKMGSTSVVFDAFFGIGINWMEWDWDWGLGHGIMGHGIWNLLTLFFGFFNFIDGIVPKVGLVDSRRNRHNITYD